MSFVIKECKKKKISNPILIEGLPGIGNVGKIAADFIVDNISAEKVYQVWSHNFPHAVFVNEDNLVELPLIEIYHKKIGAQDFLFLIGDIQPIDERSCYEFCEVLLDFLKRMKCKEIITLGGIGLNEIPDDPKVYITGNNKKVIKSFKGEKLAYDIYGVVGPIVGVTGLLVGLAERWNLSAVALLGETLGHPQYLGIKGGRAIIQILNTRFNMKLKLKELNSEIQDIEKEIGKKVAKLEKLKSQQKSKIESGALKETTYIG